MFTDPTTESDRVQGRLIECASSCLEHIRNVRWGIATSQYEVTDGELQISVLIEVKCFRKADQKEQPS